MVPFLILLATNYLVGWIWTWVIWSDDFGAILSLTGQEESPENSLEIRQKIQSLPMRAIILSLFGGAVPSIVYALICKAIELKRDVTEAKRRYAKAKRGHGIKNDLKDYASDEDFTDFIDFVEEKSRSR